MASSSYVPESSMHEDIPESTTQDAPTYEIKGRTMSLEEWDLRIQMENPVDFISLAYHGCDIRSYYEKQELMAYFDMLNGPTYETLLRHFWVRASVYDRAASKLEETEKVLLDPTLEGNTREEMGLEPFRCVEIRSSIMRIPVFISEKNIAFVLRRDTSGKYAGSEISNPKTSPWKEIVNKSMFNNEKKGTYADLSMEKKMLLKIQNENLLPKSGGSDQPSLEHRVFLHFFISKDKVNVPKYIFKHIIKKLRESQENKMCWVPYGGLISEILHQGGILKALSKVNIFTDAQLGTVTCKVISGKTLRNMSLIPKDGFKELNTDMKESDAVSNLMEGFPPICKQEPLEVQMHYIKEHFALTGEMIRLEDVRETMYGGALPLATGRKSKRKAITKDEYLEAEQQLRRPRSQRRKRLQ